MMGDGVIDSVSIRRIPPAAEWITTYIPGLIVTEPPTA